jgi:predicted O-linked N-acetylglucosamine transferase (SPINDLY family)
MVSIDLLSSPPVSHTSPDMVIEYYRRAIAADEGNYSYYWQLGIAYLYNGDLAAAQSTWFLPFTMGGLEAVSLTKELVSVLDTEAHLASQREEWQIARELRYAISEIQPDCFQNIIEILILSDHLGDLSEDLIVSSSLNKFLVNYPDAELTDLDINRYIGILLAQRNILAFTIVLDLWNDSHVNINIEKIIDIFLFELTFAVNSIGFVIECCQIGLTIFPNSEMFLRSISTAYTQAKKHKLASEFARKYSSLFGDILATKATAMYTMARCLLLAGNWEEMNDLIPEYRRTIAEVTREIESGELNQLATTSLSMLGYFLPYLEDSSKENRASLNQSGSLFTKYFSNKSVPPKFSETTTEKPTDTIRIGYIGTTFREHSVGWLCRWLYRYHDRARFQIFTYSVLHQDNTFYGKNFEAFSDVSRHFGNEDPNTIAAQIRHDQIDILIDLDSLTNLITYAVMALHPAAVQITWLGWDASGNPGIDYFIADPHVLPPVAEDYYREKIWRLPHTYLAVEGFEVGIPSLRRSDLNIPADAVIYYTSQVGMKRHPDTIRLQLEIIKSVPNSYLLIKGDSDPEVIQNSFGKISEELDLGLDRLRFLDFDRDEITHRANLTIADVILDTFPYSGATTTLEALWMEVPIVTKVGQQFSARNSYTFMINAGISAGIAYSDAEYIEWGVKLGNDRTLRESVAAELRASKQRSPLWNAKSFTNEMEKAYQEMWRRHLANRC